MKEKWQLIGYDTFPEKYYSIPPEHDTEQQARQAAAERLKTIEQTQPSSQSGGQGEFGIQDRLFIQRPDGRRYRFLPLPGNSDKNTR